jgi:hypothetical protein
MHQKPVKRSAIIECLPALLFLYAASVLIAAVFYKPGSGLGGLLTVGSNTAGFLLSFGISLICVALLGEILKNMMIVTVIAAGIGPLAVWALGLFSKVA